MKRSDMPLPLLRRCCGCISLRTGCFMLCIMSTLACAANIAAGAWNLPRHREREPEDNLISMSMVMFSTLSAISNLIALFGIVLKRPSKLQWSLVFNSVFIFCIFLVAIVTCLFRLDDFLKVPGHIALIVFLLIGGAYQQFWSGLAKNELEEALKVKWNLNPAKNVILFVGDGMGPNTVTSTRIYKGGESHRLVYEKFPHVGLLKTYSANKMVPDSACTATAMFSGVKTNQDTMGVDATVQYQDCDASLKPEARLESLAALALKAGKSAGLVTTMRVTHATPGPLYAHSASRKWECEATMPKGTACKDIARQLVEDWPGRDLHVVMGGGRQALVSNSTGTASDPISNMPWTCYRQDGRNLIDTYKTTKASQGLKYSVVMNNKELGDLNLDDTDYLFGIFSNEHLNYDHLRDKGPEGMPSISDMVKAAIKVLQKNKNGFFLMVEGGNIDMAHHRGWAKTAVNEAAAMEAAVELAANMTDEEDTLLIVTSDHTHSLSINGYPDRGSSIFGIAQPSSHDGVNYTTLSYGTGGPGSFQYYVKTDENGSTVARRDPSEDDTEAFDYTQVAGIQLVENYHGGGDVAIYARGPYSHLFHNVHEQHYVFHAISYAAKMGAYSSSTAVYVNIWNLAIITAISMVLL